MLLRRTVLTLSLLGLCAAPALAQVKFERRIPENSTRIAEQTTRTEQKLTIAGMENETESDSRVTVKITVGKRDDSGNIRVQEKIESLMITTKIQGTEYMFDSSNPDSKGGSALEMLRPVHKAMAKRTSTTVFDKEGKVTQVEFDQDPLNGLDDAVRNLIKDEFNHDKIKKAANEENERLPSEPVNKGDSWERTNKRGLGAGQMLTVATRYTYEGEIEKDGKKYDRITSKVLSVELTLEDSPLPFTIKSTDLKATESKGEMLYDRKEGRVISASTSVRIVGDLTFSINNMDLPSKLDLKMETSSQPKS
ncbi:MAG: hypothetical protein HY290_30085 [Planctomycetia bacterium]|nr:hypothetical protein [Planctomycetia bacterium]